MTTPKLTATVVLAVLFIAGGILWLTHRGPQAQVGARATPTVQASGLGAALTANAQDAPPSLDDVLGKLGGVSDAAGAPIEPADSHGWEAFPTDVPLPKHTTFAAYSLEESKQIDYSKVQPGTIFYATMQRDGGTIISTGEGWFACGQLGSLQGDEAKHWNRLQPEVQQEVSALCKPG